MKYVADKKGRRKRHLQSDGGGFSKSQVGNMMPDATRDSVLPSSENAVQ
jgi:hypothetical protein